MTSFDHQIHKTQNDNINKNNNNPKNNNTSPVEKVCCGDGAAIPRLRGDWLELCVMYTCRRVENALEVGGARTGTAKKKDNRRRLICRHGNISGVDLMITKCCEQFQEKANGY